MLIKYSQGFTIGFVVIPQAMAYALLAQLSPEYGLYTSFTGAVLYWLFGTSKDIVIGVSNSRGDVAAAAAPAVLERASLTILRITDDGCRFLARGTGRECCGREETWCVHS